MRQESTGGRVNSFVSLTLFNLYTFVFETKITRLGEELWENDLAM